MAPATCCTFQPPFTTHQRDALFFNRKQYELNRGFAGRAQGNFHVKIRERLLAGLGPLKKLYVDRWSGHDVSISKCRELDPLAKIADFMHQNKLWRH